MGGPEHSTLSNDAFPTRGLDFISSKALGSVYNIVNAMPKSQPQLAANCITKSGPVLASTVRTCVIGFRRCACRHRASRLWS